MQRLPLDSKEQQDGAYSYLPSQIIGSSDQGPSHSSNEVGSSSQGEDQTCTLEELLTAVNPTSSKGKEKVREDEALIYSPDQFFTAASNASKGKEKVGDDDLHEERSHALSMNSTEEVGNKGLFEVLPTELFLHVIGYLSPADLAKIAMLNHDWFDTLADEDLWCFYLQSIFPENKTLLPIEQSKQFTDNSYKRFQQIATEFCKQLERDDSYQTPFTFTSGNPVFSNHLSALRRLMLLVKFSGVITIKSFIKEELAQRPYFTNILSLLQMKVPHSSLQTQSYYPAGYTVFMFIAEHGSVAAFTCLLEALSTEVMLALLREETIAGSAIDLIIKHNKLDILALLNEKEFITRVDLAGLKISLFPALDSPEVSVHSIKRLIALGADINEKAEASNPSPLIKAIRNGKTDIAKYLIKVGADIETPHSSLAEAFRAKNGTLITLLMSRACIDLSALMPPEEDQGTTMVALAAEFGDEEIFNSILNRYRDAKNNMHALFRPTTNRRTLLMFAAKGGNKEIFEKVKQKYTQYYPNVNPINSNVIAAAIIGKNINIFRTCFDPLQTTLNVYENSTSIYFTSDREVRYASYLKSSLFDCAIAIDRLIMVQLLLNKSPPPSNHHLSPEILKLVCQSKDPEMLPRLGEYLPNLGNDLRRYADQLLPIVKNKKTYNLLFDYGVTPPLPILDLRKEALDKDPGLDFINKNLFDSLNKTFELLNNPEIKKYAIDYYSAWFYIKAASTLDIDNRRATHLTRLRAEFLSRAKIKLSDIGSIYQFDPINKERIKAFQFTLINRVIKSLPYKGSESATNVSLRVDCLALLLKCIPENHSLNTQELLETFLSNCYYKRFRRYESELRVLLSKHLHGFEYSPSILHKRMCEFLAVRPHETEKEECLKALILDLCPKTDLNKLLPARPFELPCTLLSDIYNGGDFGHNNPQFSLRLRWLEEQLIKNGALTTDEAMEQALAYEWQTQEQLRQQRIEAERTELLFDRLLNDSTNMQFEMADPHLQALYSTLETPISSPFDEIIFSSNTGLPEVVQERRVSAWDITPSTLSQTIILEEENKNAERIYKEGAGGMYAASEPEGEGDAEDFHERVVADEEKKKKDASEPGMEFDERVLTSHIELSAPQGEVASALNIISVPSLQTATLEVEIKSAERMYEEGAESVHAASRPEGESDDEDSRELVIDEEEDEEEEENEKEEATSEPPHKRPRNNLAILSVFAQPTQLPPPAQAIEEKKESENKEKSEEQFTRQLP